MYFHSTLSLPEGMTNHERMAWTIYVTRFSEALRESSFRPAESAYIQGCHDITGRDGAQVYTDKSMTYCDACALSLRTEIVAARQTAIRAEPAIAPKLGRDPADRDRLLARAPEQMDWWDLDELFADAEDAPSIGEGGCPNHDSGCTSCGVTLDHALSDTGFGDEVAYWRETTLARVSAETLYQVLLMMEHAPGDREVLSFAAETARILGRDGLFTPETESTDVVD